MKKITCCYKCPDRRIGCHAICEKYLAERADLDAEKAAKAALQVQDDCFHDAYLDPRMKNLARYMKRHNKRGNVL